MEDFSITTRLTTKDYTNVMFIGLYKRPVFILATIVALFVLAELVFYYFFDNTYFEETPWVEIGSSLFLLLFPSVIVFVSVRQLKSNPSLLDDMHYTFGENGVAVQGLTFKGESEWTHFIKYKEIGNYVMLYQTKRLGNFIDKSKLTDEQLEFIKSKVKKK